MPITLRDTQSKNDPAADDVAKAPRRRDPEATRKAILDAAEELFVCHGPAATSVSQVARQAGVTKSLIHHHFGTKEELWREVQKRHFRLYYEMQKQMLTDSEDNTELLRDSMIAYYRFLQADPKSVRFMSWAFCEEESDQCAGDPEKELFEMGIERIRKAQEDGTIRPDLEPLFVIKTMIALPLQWFQTRALTMSMLDSEIEPEQLDERYLEDMVRIFLEGVRNRDPEDSTQTA